MWLTTQAVPTLMAPLSILLAYTTNATVDTLLRANKLVRQAKLETSHLLVMHGLTNPCVLAWGDAAWGVRREGSSQGGYFIAMADGDALHTQDFRMNIISWHSGKLARVARSSSAAEVQAAGSTQEEQEYVRLVMYEILYGKFPLTEWAEACPAIPGALIMDCRGIFDALNSESSGLGMKDKRSAVEALALRRAMNSTGTTLCVTVELSCPMS